MAIRYNVYLCSYCGGKSQQNPAREGALLCEHCGAAFGRGDHQPATEAAQRAPLPPPLTQQEQKRRHPVRDTRHKGRYKTRKRRSWWYRFRRWLDKAEDAVDDLEDIVDDIFD